MRNPDLAYLAERWEPLNEYRFKGSARPWREPINRWLPDTDETVPTSSGAAPMHLSTFALIEAIRAAVRDWTVQAGRTPERTIPELLSGLDGLVPVHPASGSWGREVAGWAADTAHRVRDHLGEVGDGQRLKAICPWCWYQSMVIRCLDARGQVEPFVRCESGVCAPSEHEVSTWWEGLPCWPVGDWPWLAGRLDRVFDDAA